MADPEAAVEATESDLPEGGDDEEELNTPEEESELRDESAEEEGEFQDESAKKEDSCPCPSPAPESAARGATTKYTLRNTIRPPRR